MNDMPRTLTLVRHGESESNVAKKLTENGGSHPNEAALMKAHTSRRRLSKKGVKQAIEAGEWLRNFYEQEAFRRKEKPYENLRGFVSPYIRAIETAGHLNLPITWLADARLSERNYGEMDQLTYEERIEKYGNIDLREQHGIFWPAANGETLLMVATRMWQHFDKLIRDYSNYDVIEVSHGETMLTQRFMLERWLPEDVVQIMLATDKRLSKKILGKETDWRNKIINCRIIQYTREKENSTWDDKYCKIRMIAPSSLDDPNMNAEWAPIVRRKFTTNQLLKYAEQFPHFLDT